MNKDVKYIIPATDVNMGGIIVKQALPANNVNQVDPFLLLHHGKFNYTENSLAIQQGIGPHPHRGFTPVTFVIDGEVHHRDSRGNNQVAKKGEIQWMHAGAGIIHSERPSQALAEKNGTQEIIQLWINSPADKKMQEPSYQYIKQGNMPVFLSDDNQITNRLIAGNFKGLQSKIETESELLVLWCNSNAGGTQTYNIPKGFNSMLYVISGAMKISSYGKVEKENLIVFDNKSEAIEIFSESNAIFLLLSGLPINEKVVQHGPFVMNTQTEIMEAMRDYQNGKMGVLIE
ncbi:pirin family protein [Bacteroidota bacterium]